MITALLLIAAGLVLLLNNLGALDWGVWSALSDLWPLLLVGLGLDLMFKKRRLVPLLIGLALLLLVGAGLALLDREPVRLAPMEVRVPLEAAREAELRLELGTATLELRGDAPDGVLLQGRVEHPEGEPAELRVRRDGERLGVRLEGEREGLGGLRWRADAPRWDLALAAGVPLDLRVQTGLGSAELDLGAVHLARLKVDAGLGHTRLTLPARGRYRARIEAGVGRLEIRLARGFPARIEVESGLGSVRVAGDWRRDGHRYTSPGFEQATDRVELEVEAGVGAVEVEQIEPPRAEPVRVEAPLPAAPPPPPQAPPPPPEAPPPPPEAPPPPPEAPPPAAP